MSPAESPLRGHELPAGGFRVEPAEDGRLREVLGSPAGAGEAHPLWAYIAAQRGIGVSVAELCALAEFDVADGPLLGSVEIELAGPIGAGEELWVEGEIVDLVRKEGRSGRFDLLVFEERLRDREGRVVSRCRNTFVLPRREES